MEQTSLADLVIAPLTLLERSRGWKRRGLILLYLMIALVVGVFGWRELSLWRLPNAPEPFDLLKYGRLDIPDADNAMVAYRSVIAKFGQLDTKGYQVGDKAWSVTDWSVADPEVRRWAEDHRDALAAWLPATERSESLLVQPEDMRYSTLIEPAQQLRPYVRLALLEGSRLEQAGDLAGSWRMYRAALRASRHVGRHGAAIQRIIGQGLLQQVQPRIEAWITQPGLSAELLKRATDDVATCASLTAPASDLVRSMYFSTRSMLDRPEEWARLGSDEGLEGQGRWYNQFKFVPPARHFLHREPERSLRILRLLTASNLAQCDRPRALRPKLVAPKYMIFAHDAQTPPAVRSISPEELTAWADRTILGEIIFDLNYLQTRLDLEKSILDTFLIEMAQRAYQIEHGRPAKIYGELLGPYLKALPEGIEPEDPANPTPE